MTYNIIIPVFNEERNIYNLINKLSKNFIIKDQDCKKIILVNDGSFDNSQILLNKYSKKIKKIIILNHKHNLGYGAALKTGIKYSKKISKYCIFLDSDLTNPLSDIKKIRKFMAKDVDYIQANRYKKDTSKIQIHRKLLGTIGNILCKIFVNMKIHDYTNGFRAVKLKLYKNFELRENDFSIIMEEKYKIKKFINTIAQFDTVLGSRGNDLKKSSFNYSIKLITKYLFYCLLSVLKTNKNLIKID